MARPNLHEAIDPEKAKNVLRKKGRVLLKELGGALYEIKNSDPARYNLVLGFLRDGLARICKIQAAALRAPDERSTKIIRALKKNREGSTPKDLQRLLNIPYATVREDLAKLLKAKKVRREKNKRRGGGYLYFVA